MTRRRRWLPALGIAFTLSAAACAGAIVYLDRYTDRRDAGCTSQTQAFTKTVQDSRKWTEKDIPGIGDYLEVHWLGRPASDPCSRVPGPTDWYYQGFVRLRPPDAAALQTLTEWKPRPPQEIWPDLMHYAPAHPQWLGARNDTAFVGDLHLDPGTGILFFSLLHG